MWPRVIDDGTVVSLADLAEMAQVSRPAVSNWRRRHADFPMPVAETGAVALFRLSEVEAWMQAHNKRFADRSVAQQVWSAFNSVRGEVSLEQAVMAAIAFVGLAATRARSGHSLDWVLDSHDPDELVDWMYTSAREVARSGHKAIESVRVDALNVRAAAVFVGEIAKIAVRGEYGEVVEGLVSALTRERRAFAQHQSPESIVRLLVALGQPLDGTVCDPACGFGGILSAVRERADDQSQLRFVGRELVVDVGQVALFRMLAHDVAGEITFADTFSPVGKPMQLADLVLLDSPFGRGQRLDWVERAVELLKPRGRAFVITPRWPLIRSGCATARQDLVARGCVRAVVTLPEGLHNPYSSIPAVLWYLGPPRENPRPVLLADATMLGNHSSPRTSLADEDIAAIESLLRGWTESAEVRPGIPARAVPVDEFLKGDSSLLPERWIEQPQKSGAPIVRKFAEAVTGLRDAHEQYLAGISDVPTITAQESDLPLSSMRELVDRGLFTIVRSRRIDSDLWGTGTHPLIRPGDLTGTWSVAPGTTIDPERLGHTPTITRSGDVLVVADGAKSRVAVDRTGGSVVAAPVHIVRRVRARTDPLVLAAVLTKAVNRHAALTQAKFHVDLYGLQLPVLDDETADRLARVLEGLINREELARAAAQAAERVRACLVDGVGSGVSLVQNVRDAR